VHIKIIETTHHLSIFLSETTELNYIKPCWDGPCTKLYLRALQTGLNLGGGVMKMKTFNLKMHQIL